MPWTLVVSLIVFAPLAGINIYVGRTLFRDLSRITAWNRSTVRWTIVGVIVLVNLLPVAFLVAYLAAGRAAVPAFAGDVPSVDLFLTYPFWIALVISVQLLVLFGLLDIASFVIRRIVPGLAVAWIRRRPAITVSVAVFITLYSLVVIVHDTWSIRIVEREVSVPERYKAIRGLRIAQISDVQGDGRTTPERLREYVSRVNSLKPDLVLFAGDLVTSGTLYIDSTAAVLGGLKARYGSIAAIGDHDIFSRKSMVLQALVRARVTVVEDSTIAIKTDSATIAVTVVTYTYSQKPSNGRLGELLTTSDDHYRVLLVHQPAETLIELAASRGYQLFIAGHTHGGGIAFGIPGVFLLAPAHAESRFVSGFFHVKDLLVSVTNGLGFTLAPIRYHAPAEIVIITLR
jgi:predicted MPP superfamily phosphohydrolase